MSIGELSNNPIEITLGGRKLKIQRLSINELFAPAHSKIQSDYIANIQNIAKSLSGKDKIDYLSSATSNIPKGSELDALALEYLSSPIGVAQMLMVGFNKCQQVSEEEVANLMVGSNSEELEFISSYLSGNTDDKKKLNQDKVEVIK